MGSRGEVSASGRRRGGRSRPVKEAPAARRSRGHGKPRRGLGVSSPRGWGPAASEEMLRVALTGGIATGKSYVLDRFRARGVPCLDADALAHGVMAAGTEAAQAIAARFGTQVVAADGTIDRRRLGAI